MLNQKVVVFVSTLSFSNNTTAGYNRIMNYAKALAENSITIIFLSFYCRFKTNLDLETISTNIFRVKEIKKRGSYWNFFLSLIRIKNFLKNNYTCFIFYPTSKFCADFIFLIVSKLFSSCKIFCEINELRRTYPKNRFIGNSFHLKLFKVLKNLIDIFFFKILEYSTFVYDGIIVISTNLYNYYIRYNKKIIKIPILIDIRERKNNSQLLLKDSFKIGFFGTISIKKEGINNILLTIKNLNEKGIKTELFLYGPISKDEYEFLQEQIMLNKLINKIFYKGILQHDAVLNEMQKMNLLILPRPLNEQTKYGFSTKLAEYLISGIPVLVTNVSDNSKYIKDGVNGYIVEDITPSGFEDKIMHIIKNYEKMKNGIVKEAYKTAKKYFDYRLYKETLNKFLFEEN